MAIPDSNGRAPATRVSGPASIAGLARRHRMIIAGTCVAGALVGFLDQIRKDPVHEATSQVIVRSADVSSRIRGGGSAEQNTNRLVTTLAELVKATEVLDEAASRAGLGPADRDTLDRKTTVATKVDSDVIDIATRWGSEDQAIRLANAVAQSFVAYRRQIDVGPLIAAEADLARTIERLERTGGGGNTLQALISARVDLNTDIQLGGRNSIVVQANEAERVAPRPKLWTALGGLLGLLGGIGIVMLLGRRAQDRARSGSGASLDLPVLARIPALPSVAENGTGPLALSQSPPPEADAFWGLLASLDLLDPSRRYRAVLVVGATADDGAPSIAANLAAVEARSGRSVALCDFDLRQPTLARLFGYSPQHEGVTSVLTGQVGLSAALESISIAPAARMPAPVADPAGGGLALLLSGPPVPNPSALSGSVAVAHLVNGLRDSASRVYLAAPPWLSGGDAAALSRHVDAIVLVRRKGRPERPESRRVEDMMEWLERMATPVIGVVVSDVAAAGAVEPAPGAAPQR